MLSNPFQAFLRRLNTPYRLRRTRRTFRRTGARTKTPQDSRIGEFAADTLEERLLLSATPLAPKSTVGLTAQPTFIIEGHDSSPGAGSTKPATSGNQQAGGVAPVTPAEMVAGYGVNQIMFGSVKGTGAGQTIAIVDAFADPDIVSDAAAFSGQFGLPQFNANGGPTFQVLNQNGGTSLANVPISAPGGWDVEESLDVECGAFHGAAGKHHSV